MLNADATTNPLAAEHQDSERALRAAGVPFTLLRNGWYTENYTDQLGQYLSCFAFLLIKSRRRPRLRERPGFLAGWPAQGMGCETSRR
jgi:uncharacterized protein YbjT (DUF2867 family)